MSATTWWAQIETSGNQAFIFASNRLRENAGASRLVKAACTTWVEEAIANASGVRTIISTSGRALLQSDSRESLETVIRTVTTRALREAPGLTVTGAVIAEPATTDIEETSLSTVIRRLSDEVGRVAGRHSSVASRFPRLPVLRGCAHSQFPAEHFVRDGAGDSTPLSEVAYRKRQSGTTIEMDEHPRNLNELEVTARDNAGIGWFGVVHADGNSVGKLFLDLGALCMERCAGDSSVARALHETVLEDLSKGLHNATETAVREAESAVGVNNVVRIIVGGDDVTVVCVGRVAVEFARVFLESFQLETSVVTRRVRDKHGIAVPDRLTAAAGVAIVKPHFPFFVAYELAEELAAETKARLKALSLHGADFSALDVHVMADTSQSSLQTIRSGRRSGDTRLWGGPYTVETDDLLPLRTASWLMGAITSAAAVDDDGRRTFPRSAAMRVKAALYDDPRTIDQVASELLKHIPRELLDSDGALLSADADETSTAFVDVLDLVDIVAEAGK